LYARILRVANSPYYGQTRSITTLERAIVVLGLDAVRGIAAAACLDRTIPRGRHEALIDFKSLVGHSLATAAAGESLARIRHPTLAAEAFIAGLLHNLGVVVQLSLDRPGTAAMIDLRAADDSRDMRALESERATVGHEECIALVFEEWQLPQSLIAAARDHHEPMDAHESHRDLASLVNLGAHLGLAAGSTFALEPGPSARNRQAMAWLGLEDADIDAVAADLPARVLDLRTALLDS
jgi:HD-like signal output (HDOD) protein